MHILACAQVALYKFLLLGFSDLSRLNGLSSAWTNHLDRVRLRNKLRQRLHIDEQDTEFFLAVTI